MKAAQVTIAKDLPVENMRYLPISHLTLSNIAVDAGPFFRWFDPAKLKEITFKKTCVDTGFYLPAEMRKEVMVSGPPKPKPTVAKVYKAGDFKDFSASDLKDLKVVTLKGGKVVAREPAKWTKDGKLVTAGAAYTAGESSGGVGGAGGAGGGKGLKTKISQAMGLGKKAAKEDK